MNVTNGVFFRNMVSKSLYATDYKMQTLMLKLIFVPRDSEIIFLTFKMK